MGLSGQCLGMCGGTLYGQTHDLSLEEMDVFKINDEDDGDRRGCQCLYGRCSELILGF